MLDKKTFVENGVYSTRDVSEIINRSEKTVRQLCRRGDISARLDRGGYLILGSSLRAYLEGRCVVNAQMPFVK